MRNQIAYIRGSIKTHIRELASTKEQQLGNVLRAGEGLVDNDLLAKVESMTASTIFQTYISKIRAKLNQEKYLMPSTAVPVNLFARPTKVQAATNTTRVDTALQETRTTPVPERPGIKLARSKSSFANLDSLGDVDTDSVAMQAIYAGPGITP